MVPHSIAGSAVVALQGLGMGLVTHVHYGQAIGVGRIHRGMGWEPLPGGGEPFWATPGPYLEAGCSSPGGWQQIYCHVRGLYLKPAEKLSFFSCGSVQDF